MFENIKNTKQKHWFKWPVTYVVCKNANSEVCLTFKNIRDAESSQRINISISMVYIGWQVHVCVSWGPQRQFWQPVAELLGLFANITNSAFLQWTGAVKVHSVAPWWSLNSAVVSTCWLCWPVNCLPWLPWWYIHVFINNVIICPSTLLPWFLTGHMSFLLCRNKRPLHTFVKL